MTSISAPASPSLSDFEDALKLALTDLAPEQVEDGLISSNASHLSGQVIDAAHVQFSFAGDYEYADATERQAAQQYFAASCLGHTVDSWQYLGQAVRAAMEGQLAIAKHLTYYAELRAANAILARHGVLIRSSNHLLLTRKSGVVCSKGRGTHTEIWPALSTWSLSGAAKDFVLRSISMWGQNSKEWLDEQSGGKDDGRTLQELLRLVGFDLKKMGTDYQRRNSASYGASMLQESTPTPVPGWFYYELSDLWGLIDPTAGSQFALLDQVVGSKLLNIARQLSGKVPGSKPHAIDLERIVTDVSSTQPSIAKAFILNEVDSCASPILAAAMSETTPTSPLEELLGMIGRALVLARLATAASKDLIGAARVDEKGEFDVWIGRIGARGGFWASDESPSQSDLYDRAQDAMSELDAHTDAVDLSTFMSGIGRWFHPATAIGLVAAWIRPDPQAALPRAA